jgi:O-antigen ligase
VFVLAVVGWQGLAAPPRRLATPAAPVFAAAVLLGGILLKADAPVLALLLGAFCVAAVWRFPRSAPLALAAGLAGLMLLTPLILGGLDAAGGLDALKGPAPASGEQRLGYWQMALHAIAQHPFIGLGLDGARVVMGERLHPHSTSLQLWLELGAIGAALAAWLWGVIGLCLRRPATSLAAALSAATAVTYFVFGAFNFGVWQEWWLSLAVFAGAFSALALRNPPAVASRPST